MTKPSAAARGLSGLGPAIVLVGSGLLVAWILALTGGRFSYALDDPYIHLAVAEHLAADGHYGINAGEPAAPCSSLLWPFLLVPFAWLGAGQAGPLVLNVAAALLLCGALGRVASRVLHGRRDAPLLAALLLLPANVFGLVFTGLEHTLQVALVAWTVALVAGWAEAPARAAPPPALLGVLVLGPFVRFENLAISLPLLGVLFLVGPARGRTLLASALLVGLVGGFSAWLASRGLDPVPTSLAAKSAPLVERHIPGIVARQLDLNLNYRQLALLTLVLPLAAFVALRRGAARQERAWAVAVASAVVGHLVLGTYGGFFRYDVAIVMLGLLSALLWLRGPILAGWNASPGAARAAWAAAAVVVAVPALVGWSRLPQAGRQIWEQQGQLGRFAKEHWEGPVAVNDLGWVAWGNDRPVLDLWGLGSPATFAARRAARLDPDKARWKEWMSGELARHGVEVALIYEAWFPERPKDWVRVGRLRLSGPRTTPHQDEVAFFATTPAAARRLASAVAAWEAGLPDGVPFLWDVPRP